MIDLTSTTLRNQTSDCPQSADGPLNTDDLYSALETAPTGASDLARVGGNDPVTRTTILRLRDVTRRTGLGRSSIYAFMAQGTFPLAHKLSGRTVGWFDCDVEAWITARPLVTSNERAAKRRAQFGSGLEG